MTTHPRTIHSDRGAASLGSIIFGVIIVVVGAVIVYLGWSSAADAQESKSWPTAPGTVLESRVEVVPGDVNDPSDSYNPVISYNYTVDGTTYTSSQVAFGLHNSGNEGAVRNKVASYPAGKSIQVAYDPADHGRAVLEPGEEGMSSFMMMMGGTVILSGLMVAVLIPLLRAKLISAKENALVPPSDQPSDPPSSPIIS